MSLYTDVNEVNNISSDVFVHQHFFMLLYYYVKLAVAMVQGHTPDRMEDWTPPFLFLEIPYT